MSLRTPRADLAVCTLLAVACVTAQPKEEERVRASIDFLIAADNRSDLAAVLDGYCRDAELVPPQGEPIRGHAAIQEHYTEIFSTWRPALEAAHAETRIANGLGYDRGRTLGVLVPLAGGESRIVDDVYEAVLREEEGTWRVLRLAWRPRSAPSPP